MVFLVQLIFITNIFILNFLDRKFFFIALINNQLNYIFKFPFTYILIKLKNLLLVSPGVVNSSYQIIYVNFIMFIKNLTSGQYFTNFFKKPQLLTPSLEIYYPILSSIISITIRITGIFSIIFIQLLF